MPPTPAAATLLFRRRAVVGAFVGGLLQGLTAVGVVGAVTLLVVRLGGGYLAPHPSWGLAVLPALLWAVHRARVGALTLAAARAHLDERLGLHGLLLTAGEGTLDPIWNAQLTAALQRLPVMLPRVRWRQLLPAPLLAAAFAAIVALLPPPPSVLTPQQSPALRAELETLAATVRDLFERGQLPEEVKQELQQKLAELQRKVDAGEVPEWRDLDQLDQRLEREQLLQAAREPGARPGDGGNAASGERSEAPTPGQLAAAAKALVDSGLLDRLPGELRSALQKAQRPDGSFDPEALPQDAKSLAKLAEAMAGAAGKFGEAELGSGLDAGKLADLQAVLEQFGHGQAQQPQPGGQGQGQGEGEGELGGRGGVDRGPGHSVLSMTEDAQGGADNVLPLPPGRALPGDWVPLGSAKSEPTVQPESNQQAGGAGDRGAGGASWQLDLAPRHRAVLRRFFDTTAPQPTKDKR